LRPGLRYVAGLFIGTNVVALAVITGVAAIIFAHPAIRTVLLVASTGYLLFLAFRIATAGANVAFTAAPRPLGLRDGLALQAINPKAYAVNTTLFTGFTFLPDATVTEAVLELVIMNAIWLPIHVVWLLAGIWLNRLALAPEVQRRINIAMALSLLIVVALALFSLRG